MGTHELNQFDPFLLLDEFKNDNPDDYSAGFPPHPHRGFETVTYMIQGSFDHADSRGNRGHLVSGSVQWMTAGSGIIHSEMPAQEEGMVWGFQLWLNLPKKLKMIEPSYQDISAETIPVTTLSGVTAKIIGGEFNGVKGPGIAKYPVHYFDLTFDANAKFNFSVPADQNSMIYVISGSAQIGDDAKAVEPNHLALLDEGTEVQITAKQPLRCLFISAQKMNEPISRGGPFVMNTKEEIFQAFADYQSGKFGKL
jgi:redox-sensitive bicupin YhaK (pirin superfamily)